MKSQLENVLIDCLGGTLNVLYCADSAVVSRSPDRTFRRYPLFSVFHAGSPDSARELLRQVRCWHAVVIDDQTGGGADYHSALTDCQSWMPAIVVFNEMSGRSGWAADRVEQAEEREQELLIEEGEPRAPGPVIVAQVPANRSALLVGELQRWAVMRKLLGRNPSGVVKEAMHMLFTESPMTVEDWSSGVGVRPRKFQREFKKFTALAPKKLLALYHAYRIAFESLERQMEFERGAIPAYLVDDKDKLRVMEYVLTRRSTLISATYG